MARVLKKFQTESEYQAWVNGPDMRTPYTCMVTETGNIHYSEGSDDDYSITATIKMTGWITIATRGMMRYIDKIYKNGVEMNFRDKDSEYPDLTFAGRQTYYYRKKLGDTHYYKLQDYILPYAFYAHSGCNLETLVDRGVTFEGGGNIFSTRFGATKIARNTDFDTNGHRMEIRRFLFVEKGDTVKIVFNSHDSKRHVCLLGNGYYHSEIPQIGFFNKYASEVIIGDGFKSVDLNIIKMSNCKKIFLGKNIRKCTFVNYPRGYYKHRIFANSKIIFSGSMPLSRIITIN